MSPLRLDDLEKWALLVGLRHLRSRYYARSFFEA
jgi:hypothetical protein